MKTNIYQDAITILIKIFNEEAYLNILLSNYLNTTDLTIHEKSLITKIIYGVCDKKILLDYYTQPLTKGKRLKPYLRNALRIAIYVIEELSIANHYIVNELVQTVKNFDYHASSFLNAILRSYINNNIGYIRKEALLHESFTTRLSIEYSIPEEIVYLLASQYHSRLELILKATLAEHEYNNTYRFNYLKQTKEKTIMMLDELNISYQLFDNYLITKESLIATSLIEEGYLVIQDASSIKVSEVANPKPFDYVLDCCSAPGSKAMHMAMIMENKGEILAGDIYQHKLNLISQNIDKLGVKIVKPLLFDATIDKLDHMFDLILADVPCSGLGVIRHKPDLKYRMTIDKIKAIKETQMKIINHVCQYVKPNGFLVYSTCTINQDENEKMTNLFLNDHQEFNKITELIILPDTSNNNDGFYICKMQRRSN